MTDRCPSYIAGDAVWMTPSDKQPPLGTKMLLLNPGGVCVIGLWSDRFIAWAPLPKIPSHIKDLL